MDYRFHNYIMLDCICIHVACLVVCLSVRLYPIKGRFMENFENPRFFYKICITFVSFCFAMHTKRKRSQLKYYNRKREPFRIGVCHIGKEIQLIYAYSPIKELVFLKDIL